MKKILYILLFLIFISSIAAAGASDANETIITENIQDTIRPNSDESENPETNDDEFDPVKNETSKFLFGGEYDGPTFPSSKPYPHNTQYYYTFTDANITENIETHYTYEFPLNIL